MKQNRTWAFYILVPVTVLVLLAAILGLATRPEQTYKFVSTDHPIDMWAEGKDRWAYFGASGFGPIKDVADKARLELTALGFKEDSSRRPWYRFVKDNVEVIVCDHNQFALNTGPQSSKLVPGRGGSPQNYPCVLVKNGPGTSGSLAGFQVKKLIHGW